MDSTTLSMIVLKGFKQKNLKNTSRTSKTFNRLHNIAQLVDNLKPSCPIILQWFNHTKYILYDTVQCETIHFDSLYKDRTRSQDFNQKHSAKESDQVKVQQNVNLKNLKALRNSNYCSSPHRSQHNLVSPSRTSTWVFSFLLKIKVTF